MHLILSKYSTFLAIKAMITEEDPLKATHRINLDVNCHLTMKKNKSQDKPKLCVV